MTNYEEPTPAWVVILATIVIVFVVGLMIWLNQGFEHTAKIVAFRVDAVSTYQVYTKHRSCSVTMIGKVPMTTCRDSWSWDNSHEIHNALDDRSNPDITCKYDAEANEGKTRWLCDIQHYITVNFDNKNAQCRYDNERWSYVELNSDIEIFENRLGEVSCPLK